MRAWWLPVAAALVVLTGCGQAAEPSVSAAPTPSPATTSAVATPTPTPTPTPAPAPAETPTPTPSKAVTRGEVTLADGKAEPNGDKIQLAVGDTVEFVVTSDHNDELHIHGMDHAIPVKKGKTVVERVTVETTGRFEVESHHPALVIVQLIVR